MSDPKRKFFSRRSFLTTGAAACASGMALSAWGMEGNNPQKKKLYETGGQLAVPGQLGQLSHEYIPDKRTHPAEGLKREHIVITDIRVTPLSYVAPKDKYLWCVGGLVVWKSDAALVQVFTNKGIIGIGEGSPYCYPDKIKDYTDTFITPLLKGANVFDVDFLTNNQGHSRTAMGAWAGVNNAIWDVIGKALGKPVYKILAGNRLPSGKVHMYASGGVEHAWYDNGEEALIAEALRYKKLGFDTFKFRQGTSWKFSGMTMGKYVRILENLRKAVGPDFKLCIEKFPWDMDTIVNELCPVLESLKFYWYEEPFEFNVPDVVEKLLTIKAAMPSVMVSGGENCWNRYQLEPFINSGAMDVVQSDTNYTGITEGWYIGQEVAKYGRKYDPHNWVGGLTTISNVHLVAGVPGGHMCETNMTYNPLKWEIFKEPYEIKNGWLMIPDKPGYGVELIDNIEKKFPFSPGFYGRPNPKMEGAGLPLWWS
ncbi:MAG: mandelate racemase/muconate lactonizing enzyme family protein [Chitinophagaceae bacterium]|nr:mandelate racemase/muconate lactonizing enzyme family protein [Chitinophagaceae bacterium]